MPKQTVSLASFPTTTSLLCARLFVSSRRHRHHQRISFRQQQMRKESHKQIAFPENASAKWNASILSNCRGYDYSCVCVYALFYCYLIRNDTQSMRFFRLAMHNAHAHVVRANIKKTLYSRPHSFVSRLAPIHLNRLRWKYYARRTACVHNMNISFSATFSDSLSTFFVVVATCICFRSA